MPSCNFTAANLNQTDMSESVCAHSDFTQSQLIGSKVCRVNAKSCKFDSADLSVSVPVHLSKVLTTDT